MFAVLAVMILNNVDRMIGTWDAESGFGLISGVFFLVILIPGLALGARRLHDINKSGWWQLISLVYFLIIILLWWAAKPSDDGTNKHGPVPRHPTPQ